MDGFLGTKDPDLLISSAGYMFPDATTIAPHLEPSGRGITAKFCSELSGELKCYVVAGYPEKLTEEDKENADPGLVGANSAVLFGPNGQWVGGYRKTNLFDTDTTWAIPGE
jgi:protein N-terminal amidase